LFSAIDDVRAFITAVIYSDVPPHPRPLV